MTFTDPNSNLICQNKSQLSVLDSIDFFRKNWKNITGFTLLGIAGATLYLMVVPGQYEAIAQIKMAQIVDSPNSSKVAIENPEALISRMAIPSSYPKETVALCNLANESNAQAVLIPNVKITNPKGLAQTINLNVRDTVKERAYICANAIYQMILTTQAQLVAPYITNARKELVIQQERLSRITQILAKTDQSEVTSSIAYLATRDEALHLRNQITALQYLITFNESHLTSLTAPIYVNDRPFFPKKSASLISGVILGLGIGVLFALIRTLYPSFCNSVWRDRMG